jgi:hypothetical protein
VPLEPDPEHLGRLALVPVAGGPQVGDRRQRSLVATDPDLDPHVVVVLRRRQVGDHLEALLRAVVDGGGELAVVAGEVGLVAQEPAEIVVLRRRHRGDGVPVLLGDLEDVVPEARAQPRLDVSGRQGAG